MGPGYDRVLTLHQETVMESVDLVRRTRTHEDPKEVFKKSGETFTTQPRQQAMAKLAERQRALMKEARDEVMGAYFDVIGRGDFLKHADTSILIYHMKEFLRCYYNLSHSQINTLNDRCGGIADYCVDGFSTVADFKQTAHMIVELAEL